MKKLIVTLGLLAYGSNTVYGMNRTFTNGGITCTVNTDLELAINNADWIAVIRMLKSSVNDASAGLQLDSTDPAILNKANNDSGRYLLPTLLDHSTDDEKDACRLTLELLITKNVPSKLNLTATDRRGKLLCNHDYLNNRDKNRLVTLLTKNNIPNPFTQTTDPDGNITFHLKPKPLLGSISITNYKLWIVGAAALAVAAIGIYKWYTKKAVTQDDEDVEDDTQTDEKLEETANEPVTA